MARKKSATKKAKEAQEAELKQKQELEIKAEPEVQKSIQEQFDSEDESSSSEEEDDFGELLTEGVEDGFNKVLNALKNKDKSLFDPSVKFFNDEGKEVKDEKKQKPIYLKDYHRMNLLSGKQLSDDEDENQEDAPRTYQQEKDEERHELLSEIKNAFNDIDEDDNDDENEDEEDGFLKKKEHKEDQTRTRILPNPDVNEEKFLDEFTKQHAWIPQNGDKEINLDRLGEEEDEKFEDAAEKFEHAYNFRYEDPNAAEIISYARTQATVRRNEQNGRKKKRELEREEREKEKKEKEKAITKKKTEKINKLTDILEQVKKEYGAEINDDLVKRISNSLLDKDFDDSQWDTLLADIFNDDFYNDESGKPQWDDDDEIMKEFNEGKDQEEQEDEEDQDKEEPSEEPLKKKSKKDELKEKKGKKKDKKQIKEIAEKAIEANELKIVDEIEEEREGRSKEKKVAFKYREVSPETFGLSTREILIADDTDLNELVGLKKLAPYRPKELRVKDRRKIAKSRNLKEWRKKVFKNESGPKDDGDEILIPVEQSGKDKQRKPQANKRKHNSS